MRKIFNNDDLELTDWQYYTNHNSTLKFRIGDIIFLKSNPEIKLRVINVNTEKVFCIGKDKDIIMDFFPQTILHYKDAGLMVYKKQHIVSLN